LCPRIPMKSTTFRVFFSKFQRSEFSSNSCRDKSYKVVIPSGGTSLSFSNSMSLRGRHRWFSWFEICQLILCSIPRTRSHGRWGRHYHLSRVHYRKL
jgi:hypothetical protein